MPIDPEKALLFAQAFLKISQRTLGSVPTGFPDLTVSSVFNAPVLVKDLTGPDLFYDFPLVQDHIPVGSVRIAADPNVGHPFISIQNVAPVKRADIVQAALAKAASEFPLHQVKSFDLVCFDFPRIGLLLTLDKDASRLQRIFDPEFPKDRLLPLAEGGGPIPSEGTVVHSLLQTLPARDTRGFDHADRLVEGMVQAGANRLGLRNVINLFDLSMSERLRSLDDALENQPEGIGAPAERILEVPLIAQDQTDFCVLASIEMLLKFFHIASPANQVAIRGVLVENPPLYQMGSGVLPENQIAAFRRCFPPERFDTVMDNAPTWQKAHDLINRGVPLKSGIFGHSRVAVGYQDTAVTTSATGSVIERHRLLWINDPDSTQIRLELYEVETAPEGDPANTSVRETIPIKTNYVVVTQTH